MGRVSVLVTGHSSYKFLLELLQIILNIVILHCSIQYIYCNKYMTKNYSVL